MYPQQVWFDTRSGNILSFLLRAVVSYWRKYVHEVLVNRLGGLSLPRKSVVRLTDRPDMTLDVYRGRKTTMQQHNKYAWFQNDPLKTVRGVDYTNSIPYNAKSCLK